MNKLQKVKTSCNFATMSEFGDRLRCILIDRDLNPNNLAEKSGVPYSGIRKILTGETPSPGLETIKKIAKALGLKTWQLIKNTVTD